MKKLSLKTYSKYQLIRLDVTHTLKIRKMIYDVEHTNIRLLAPLATYLYLNNYNQETVGPRLAEVLNDMYEKYPNISEANALEYLKNSKNLDLNKYYNSFISENIRRDENDIKDKYRNAIVKFKKQKDISNYKICKLVGIDVGNFHSFYVLNRNEKLSVSKLEKIINVFLEI